MGAGSDAPDTVQWDWYDGSLHDEVLKRQLMKGYEQFKVGLLRHFLINRVHVS